VAFAFELRNFRHEVAVDIELDEMSILACKRNFLARIQYRGDGARAARAHREAHLLDYDSVGGLRGRRSRQSIFKIGLCGGNHNLPTAHFVAIKTTSLFPSRLDENDIVRFHVQSRGTPRTETFRALSVTMAASQASLVSPTTTGGRR